MSSSLTLILALLGIVLTIALWAQLLARNVAVTVLVAVSPLAAAGQVGYSTQQWWRKLAKATIQLIALKPVVALILAIGLTMPSLSSSVERLLAGMLVLLLAGCAWPVMARASAVLEVHVSGGTLAGIRGGVKAVDRERTAGRRRSGRAQPGRRGQDHGRRARTAHQLGHRGWTSPGSAGPGCPASSASPAPAANGDNQADAPIDREPARASRASRVGRDQPQGADR